MSTPDTSAARVADIVRDIVREAVESGRVLSVAIDGISPAEVDERAEQLRLAGAEIWTPPEDLIGAVYRWRRAAASLRFDDRRLTITITSRAYPLPSDVG